MKSLLFFALQGLVKSDPLPKVEKNFLQIGLNIAFAIIGAFAVLWIVLAGMRLVFARDNPENIAKMRNAVIYAVIGLVIVASAAAIVNLIIGGLGK